MPALWDLLLLLFPLFILIGLGMPVFLAMGMACLLFIWLKGLPLLILGQSLVRGINSYDFLALPFYLLAGELMSAGGTTARLVAFAQSLVGHVRGGLSHVNILSSMAFSGVSGSAVADTSAIGPVLIPWMKRQGYPPAYAAAVTAASSAIGPLIPPSIPLVIYGLITHTSVGALFLAGIAPGLMMGFFLLIASWLLGRRRGYPAAEKATLRDLLSATRNGAGALLMPLVVIGGITSGLVTATEAGVLAVFYALFLGLFVHGEMHLGDLPEILGRSMLNASVLLIIISCSGLFGWLVATIGVGELLPGLILSITDDKWAVLGMLLIFFLLWGLVLDPVTAMLILVPVLMPLVTQVGINPVHFGVVVVLCLMIGLVTPPVGLLLFLSARIADTRFESIVKEMRPFLAALLLVLLAATFLPESVLWLPGVLMGRF
ncbi:MAG TPA: TRAP transporter large permease [Sedimenticola sp.]|nr:TRAP transporter large permease [Sedimenticola sp.]